MATDVETMQDEIPLDLRPYIDWFFRWAWLIGLVTVLLGLFALVFCLTTRPKYEARAGVVLLRSRAEISLGSALQTLSQEDINMARSGAADAGSVANAAQGLEAERVLRRLNSLVAIVPNGAVAQQVSEALKDVLDEEERQLSALVGAVRGEVYMPDKAVAPTSKSGSSSDTIEIVATNRDPQKAALIANAWAQAYETYVNGIYGQSAYAPFTQIGVQVQEARVIYDQAQEKLLKYLSEDDRVNQLQRQIAEDEVIIVRLRSGRQTSIAAIVDKQVLIKQQLINAYLESDTTNRLFAFNKGQDARRQILGTWLDAEVANRIAAIQRDRNVRLQTFNVSVQAELDSRMRVFEHQRADLLNRLELAYKRRDTLRSLVIEANLMRDQLVKGGKASARSNALSLLAFKGRVFGIGSGLPSFDKLDLKAASIDALAEPRSASEQLADLAGLIQAMETEIETRNQEIADQSNALLRGEGYQFLDLLSPRYLAIAQSLTNTLGLSSALPSSAVAGTEAISTSLSAFVLQRYSDLFDVGGMAKSAENVATDTPIFAEIASLYPKLFTQDALMKLSESVGDQTELSKLANQMATDLLNMKGWENVLAYEAQNKPLSQEIIQRENRVRLLQADVSRISQTKLDLQQNRDLAWSAYKTLLSKQQEVKIAAASEGTEVRFASPAVPPRKPVTGKLKNVLMGSAVSLLISLVLAMILEYKGVNPAMRYWLARGKMLVGRPASR